MRKITLSNPKGVEYLLDIIRRLPLEKHAWDITIKRHVKQRSLPQNAMMWEWYTVIGNEIGYDKDEVHNIMRKKFLPWREVTIIGETVIILTSTSDPKFTTAHMTKYLNDIDRFAADELGILLPHPQDAHYEELAKCVRK